MKTNSLKIVCLFAFCICMLFQKSLATVYNFSGKIDKLPIYLSINTDNSQISAYYFYKNRLIDIELVGNKQNEWLYLSNDFGFEDEESLKNKEVFKLKWNPKGCSGTWTKGKRILKVELKPLTLKETQNVKCTNNPYLSKEITNDLTKIKIGLFKLKSMDSVVYYNGVKTRYFIEPATGSVLFRVDSGYTEQKLVTINYFLESIHVALFLETLSCSSFSRTEIYFSVGPTDIYFNKDWMALGMNGSYYCGGAHPDETTEAFNLHIPTGKAYDLASIITNNTTLDNATIEEVFTNKVIAYFKSSNNPFFSSEPSGNADDPEMECDYDRSDLWSLAMPAVLQEEGILLYPSFEHYRGFCNWPEWSVIPYDVLEDLIEPKLLPLKR